MFTRTTLLFGALILLTACGDSYHPDLPDALELGSPRGYRMARVILHFHSPYSYDGCDYKGFEGGTINSTCVNEIRAAMCLNRVDGLFMTDHPSHMASASFQDLTLAGSNDTLLTDGSNPVGMTAGTCDNGFRPSLYIGYETAAQLTLGMNQHVGADSSSRDQNYSSEDAATITAVKSASGALMAVPHPEDRSADWIAARPFDALEIYNYHANVDPKIRKRSLGVPPFEAVPGILTYLLDPYSELNPDYGFMHFLEIYPSHLEKWNTLLGDKALKIAGIGASDSHQNTFSQKVGDGERLDAHRRIARFMSNHYLVPDTRESTLKTAVQNGRGWVVFEGLGSPVGMDFTVTLGGTVSGVGETTASLGGGTARFNISLPSLHSQSPQDGDPPVITLKLKKVLSGGKDELVALTTNSSLSYDTTAGGVYRAELTLIPRHLKGFLGTFEDMSENTYPWILTNPIYLTP